MAFVEDQVNDGENGHEALAEQVRQRHSDDTHSADAGDVEATGEQTADLAGSPHARQAAIGE